MIWFVGKLSRMTQYKQKTQTKNKNDISLGLLAYPVLMAADIILYDATRTQSLMMSKK